MARPYKKVWTGGTFDHLHAGHHELLAAAFRAGDFVVIGITADELVKSKAYAAFIQPVAERKAAIERYLTDHYGAERFQVVIQGSLYTDASLDPALEANVMCYKTEEHFHAINRKRAEHGIAPLAWVDSPAEQQGVISSTRIRQQLHERGAAAEKAH